MNMTAGQQWSVEGGVGVAWLNENWRHFYKQQKNFAQLLKQFWTFAAGINYEQIN